MSSSTVEEKVVQNCSHIHPLTLLDVDDFRCNGCNTQGNERAYCCVKCNYHLHEYCAICPFTNLSFMHPEHELRLVVKGPECICDICPKIVEGLYYHCDACDFNVHPLCTNLPQHVNHTPHPDHPLKLIHSRKSRECSVCHGVIQSWRYNCGPCGLDVHTDCVCTEGEGEGPGPHGTKRRAALRALNFVLAVGEVIGTIVAS